MNSILPNSRRHDIAFHTNGRIDISARIAHTLSLAPGDVIDIVEEKGEWYLCVKLRAGSYIGQHGGRVWPTSRGKGSFRVWSKPIVKAVLNAAHTSSTLRCPCGSLITRDNKKYITIIYRHQL